MKLTFSQPLAVLASEGDTPSRTIQGVAVPYNVNADASTGPVRFLPGSLPTDGPAPKLIMHHNPHEPVGLVTERVPTDEGMMFSARISETTAGNEALTLALDGVLDAVSVGVEPTDYEYDGPTLVVKAARWLELSLVTFPAFDAARIERVAAESDTPDTEPAPETDTETENETDTESEAHTVEAATVPTTPIAAALTGGALTRPRVTAGEYISAMLTGKPLPVMAADNYLSNIPGLLPEPLLGDVWDTQYAARPLIDAVGTRALPAGGDVFNRRYISQHTSVAEQVDDLDELASQAMTVAKQLFTKKTFGGYVNVSSQAGDWSEPALIEQLVNDMVRQYARATEAYVVSQMTAAATTAADTVADYTDGDDVIAALYAGAAEMFGAGGVMPTHLVVHSDVWGELGQSKTASGQYIFPYLNPSNSAGQMNGGAAVMNGNPLGLSLIVSNDAGAGNAFLLYGPALEVYEDRSRTGGVRVENPATASATIGLWGYIAADVIGSVLPTTSNYVLALS